MAGNKRADPATGWPVFSYDERGLMTPRIQASRALSLLAAVSTLAVGAGAQAFGVPGKTDERANWRRVAIEAAGLELRVPSDFKALPRRPLVPVAMRGKLGGSTVDLSVTWLTQNFATVSRAMLTLAAEAEILHVRGARLGNEVSAIVESRTRQPNRRHVSLIVCPRREALRVDIDFPGGAPHTVVQACRELLADVRLFERSGLTVVATDEDTEKKIGIARGFTQADQKNVRIRDSTHYRLFTTAPADEALLETLESELLPRVVAICGVKPSTKTLLPIFLHHRRSGYLLATMRLGLSAQQVEAMDGHAWDQYYATWYSGPRAPVHIHEGTHQYVTATLGLDGGGPWLQEGFARWIETQFSKETPARHARNLLRTRKNFPSLEELVAARSFLFGKNRRDGLDVFSLYDISASFVRYLAQEHRTKFRQVFLACGVLPSGHPRLVRAALEETLGTSMKKLESEWHRWLREDV